MSSAPSSPKLELAEGIEGVNFDINPNPNPQTNQIESNGRSEIV